ncbi:MAG TPA: magnesium transporter CorA family protein [Nitrososphaeraceae archaeon]|nr:magnesium transporter CorA family protein [Nitrososphaeraceae archaeon]
MTISAYVIGRHSLKQVNISEPLSVRKEMKEHPEESLWIHADDRGDIFRLQDVFGLHPLAVQAIVHTHQPSKVEEYDSYLFSIIDGVKYERQKRSRDKEGERQDEDVSNSGSPSDNAYSDNDLEEDDLYIFLEQRWIITINFNSQQLQSNIRQKISKSLMPSHRSVPIPLSEQQQQQQQSISSQRNVDSSYNRGICEMVYRFAIEEIISGYYPILDNINAKLEQIEDHVILQQQPTKSQLLDILVIRRKLSFLENTLTMITTAFTDIINGVVRTRLSKDSLRNIRSLNDRVTYLKNNVENMYQRVINLREAYNSSLNANLNETIRTLTVIATIILPLTLITGIYGMNFDVMPELHSPFGYYYSLLLMGVVAAGMLIYFKNKKWI